MPDKSGHKLGVAAQKGLKKEENLDLVQLTNGHKLGVAGNKGDLSRGVPLYWYAHVPTYITKACNEYRNDVHLYC